MKRVTVYEWCLETVDDDRNGDHSDTLAPLVDSTFQFPPEGDMRYELCLVRSIWLETSPTDGTLKSRAWAYVLDDGSLDMFRDAFANRVCDVPARFLREFSAQMSRLQHVSPGTSDEGGIRQLIEVMAG